MNKKLIIATAQLAILILRLIIIVVGLFILLF